MSANGVNTIDYITISTTGDALDFGDLTDVYYGAACTSDTTRAVTGGGRKAGTQVNNIEYFTMATTGNSSDFGDLTVTRVYFSACSDATKAVFGGGYNPAVNTLDYITIQTTGNATDFGDLNNAGRGTAAASGD